MSILKNTSNGLSVLLKPNHSIGRSLSCALIIDARDVSKCHATINWEGKWWQITDHSRNGTLLNNRSVRNERQKLRAGATLQFGSEENTIWRLLNEQKPVNYLQADSDEFKFIRLSENPILYPSMRQTEVCFSKSKNMQWIIDDGESSRPLEHGNTYQFSGLNWTYYKNEPMTETEDVLTHNQPGQIVFHLSHDEESLELRLVINNLEMTMGERVYNFLLLLLARKKLFDKKASYLEHEQGWLKVEAILADLSKEIMRDVDIYYLNVMIHRFRGHVRRLKPYGSLFTNIIERRKGKMRLNNVQVRIVKAKRD